jgi:GMP synthase PP-ATPase subunit
MNEKYFCALAGMRARKERRRQKKPNGSFSLFQSGTFIRMYQLTVSTLIQSQIRSDLLKSNDLRLYGATNAVVSRHNIELIGTTIRIEIVSPSEDKK